LDITQCVIVFLDGIPNTVIFFEACARGRTASDKECENRQKCNVFHALNPKKNRVIVWFGLEFVKEISVLEVTHQNALGFPPLSEHSITPLTPCFVAVSTEKEG
jgi:hypothetical protein